MLQLQYFNSKLKNKHINHILENYKLNYSGIKNELNKKINELIKLFLKDISSFLETTEDIANAKNKINNYEKIKNELESTRNQLKNKIYNEQKMKNDLEILTQENSLLKVKIKSLNQKLIILNNGNSNNNTNNKIRSKSPSLNKTLRQNNLNTSKDIIRTSFNKKIIQDFRKSSSRTLDRKSIVENSINKLDLSLTGKFDYSSRVLEKVEQTNSKTKKINQPKSNFSIKKSIKKNQINNIINNTQLINTKDGTNNNNTINKKRKNLKKFLMNKEQMNKINKSKKKLTENKINSNNSCTPFSLYQFSSSLYSKKISDNSSIKEFNEKNNYNPNNSGEINNIEYEDIDKKINTAIDEELKQLEQDEEKIKKLFEKINNGKISTDINLNLNENNSNQNIENSGLASIVDE